jgi:membrane protease YdiL (CAAX protease family)
MDEAEQPAGAQPRKIPFNNLFLISGLVHGYNKFSMYLVTILLFIFGYLGYQLLLIVPLMSRLRSKGFGDLEIIENPNLLFSPEALQMDRNLVLALELGMFILAFLGLYTGIKRIHRKSLTSVITGYERFRVGRFWFSFIVWGSMILLLTIVSYFTTEGELQVVFEPKGFLISAFVLILLLPIQVASEELLFRGYLVQGLSQLFRNGLAPMLITSLLFALAHMSNPETQEHGWGIMFPYYCANALFMGTLTLLDEGLELAYGIHLSNNIISGLLVTSPNSVIKPSTVFLAVTEDPGSELIAWLVMAALTFLVLYWRYRWKNFKLIIK